LCNFITAASHSVIKAMDFHPGNTNYLTLQIASVLYKTSCFTGGHARLCQSSQACQMHDVETS